VEERPRPIYLDYNATTPVDARVIEAMLPCFGEHFGNPSSAVHRYGWEAARLAEHARETIAAGIGAHPEEIIFTSGATEANNLAIKGAARAPTRRGRQLVTCATEHKAVLDPCRALAAEGVTTTVLKVDAEGLLDPEQVAAALSDETVLVSVMLANNEIGTIQPIAAIAEICHARGALLHCDATQAVGKLPVNAAALGADLLSFTAHKIYGPKGVGALMVRRSRPRVRLAPLCEGGGQEQGLRPGTVNVAGVVGFARALELCLADQEHEARRLAALRDRLEAGILARLEGVTRNGSAEHRLPNTANLAFAGVDGSALLAGLDEIAVASGAACASAEPKPSHVLLALGRPRDLAAASLRFSFGRFSTDGDADVAVAAVVRTVSRLRGQQLVPGNRSRRGRRPPR
jgi:cysteine desulfurase